MTAIAHGRYNKVHSKGQVASWWKILFLSAYYAIMQHARNAHWDNAKRVNKCDVRSVLQFQQLSASLQQHC